MYAKHIEYVVISSTEADPQTHTGWLEDNKYNGATLIQVTGTFQLYKQKLLETAIRVFVE